MKAHIKKNGEILLLAVVFSIFVPLINSDAIKAQGTKQEKCDKLADCMETFYKECYDSEFRNSFSPKLVDEFSAATSNHEDEMSRLDGYISQLSVNPSSTGYIVVYGGRTNKYGEYDIRVGRIKEYIELKNQDPNRIKFVNGGFREKFEFELWTSEIKDSFPPLSPTIAPEKVKFRGKMKPFGP